MFYVKLKNEVANMSEPKNVNTCHGIGSGLIKLADGTVIKLLIAIIDIKESGFSPFGGINFDVKVMGGISTQSVPEEIKTSIRNKPLAPPEPPKDGWEIIDIVEQKPPVTEEVVESSKGKFKVRIEAEAVMAARNMKYKSRSDEPIYWISWIYKTSWKPYKLED